MNLLSFVLGKFNIRFQRFRRDNSEELAHSSEQVNRS